MVIFGYEPPAHCSAVRFDVREIPFSTRGSWLDLSPVTGLHETSEHLHLVSHQTGMHAVLRFEPSIAMTIETCAELLRYRSDAGAVIEAAFESTDVIRIRGRGADLRVADATAVLTPFTGTYFFEDPVDGSAVFTSYGTGRRYRATLIAGSLSFDGAESLGSQARAVTISGPRGWELAIEEFETARAPYRARVSFDSVVAASASQFTQYLDDVAGWRTESSSAAALAAYVMWSATVEPRGFLRRESMLMSKHWMDKVWSWDHCFNALALAPAGARLAVDQLLVPFDHQDAAGALPDSVTHSEVLYNFVKPPIHGWALRELRAITSIARQDLAEIYERLARWTTFWLDSRRAPGHALPHYQHGNDSGWDNSTAFDLDRVLEAPDLAAFLVVQLEVLAELADELGIEADWRSAQAALKEALLAELWDGERFFANGAHGRSATTSLLLLLPIVAAEHLPSEVAEKLDGLIEQHLTEHGLATELPSSDQYEADGYWRGPIWAPSTVLIENGLRRSGHTALADEVSARFRALCERSGCRLLLDLHNLYTNARNHRFEPRAFLDTLDLRYVREIHIAGGDEMDGMWLDSHAGAVAEPVWDLLNYVCPRAPHLRGIAFEFHESYFERLHPAGVLAQLARARESWAAPV